MLMGSLHPPITPRDRVQPHDDATPAEYAGVVRFHVCFPKSMGVCQDRRHTRRGSAGSRTRLESSLRCREATDSLGELQS